jgi:hypothetical protein
MGPPLAATGGVGLTVKSAVRMTVSLVSRSTRVDFYLVVKCRLLLCQRIESAWRNIMAGDGMDRIKHVVVVMMEN